MIERRAPDQRMVRRLIRQNKLGRKENDRCLRLCAGQELLHLARANMQKRPRRAAQTLEVEEVRGREIRGKLKNGEAAPFTALTTNIFEKIGGRWLMVLHTTSRVPH